MNSNTPPPQDPPFGITHSKVLHDQITQTYSAFFLKYGFSLKINDGILEDVIAEWYMDLDRLGKHSIGTQATTPDHIKSAAFLAHWLRRFRPLELETSREYVGEIIVKFEKAKNNNTIQEFMDNCLKKSFKDLLPVGRKFLITHVNEYVAIDFCYELAYDIELKLREEELEERQKKRERNIFLREMEWDLSREVCYALRTKSISPHAIYLLYLSLLRDRDYFKNA